MSLYRFARLSALVAILRRYRVSLMRMAFALSFALVSAWQYDDVAEYLQTHFPHCLGAALIAKTLLVYAALFFCFWELGRIFRGEGPAATAAKPTSSGAARADIKPQSLNSLDRLAEKPKLRSRREGILDDET